MLAYELFLTNQGREAGFGKATPVKKIFVSLSHSNKVQIQIDNKSLEEYGGKTHPSSEELQKLLSMPLMNQPEVGLQDETTGSNASKPFLQLYGYFKNGTCTISIGKKDKDKNKDKDKEEHKFVFDFKTHAEKFVGKKPIQVRQDKKNYFIDGQLLFDAYVKSGILDSKGRISADTTKAICEKFIGFLKERTKGKTEFHTKGPFAIVVLPKDKQIIYRTSEVELTGKQKFSDSFGTPSNVFGTKTTKNAKFMSFNDKAFVINGLQGQAFYENLGISDISIKKIGFPEEKKFNIAGLDWYFLNLDDSDTEFEQTNKGIYTQLVKNYQTLQNKGRILKVICLKGKQANNQEKLEVLIDENIPTKRLTNILMLNESIKEQPLVLEEVLIHKDGKTTTWGDYIYGVRNFLSEKAVEKQYLIQIISRKARKLAFQYKAKKKQAPDINQFFSKAAFCLKLLTENHEGDKMDQNEEFANKIGKISGEYIKLKRKAKEMTHSTEDILAYSKYDRDKLRFIFQRICQSASLSKSETLKKDIESFIQNQGIETEIADAYSTKDYSYFFYKGAFSQLGGI